MGLLKQAMVSKSSSEIVVCQILAAPGTTISIEELREVVAFALEQNELHILDILTEHIEVREKRAVQLEQ